MTKHSGNPTPLSQEIPPINKSDLSKTLSILPFLSIIVAVLAIVICYFLYKKIQNLNNDNSFEKIEENFSKLFKEQQIINNLHAKKLNSLGTQFNQLHVLIQEKNNLKRSNSDFLQASSPSNDPNKQPNLKKENTLSGIETIKQPEQREMMPTSIFQTSLPVEKSNVSNQIPPPVVTINKKSEILNENKSQLIEDSISGKKIVQIENMNNNVIISEDSSDDDN